MFFGSIILFIVFLLSFLLIFHTFFIVDDAEAVPTGGTGISNTYKFAGDIDVDTGKAYLGCTTTPELGIHPDHAVIYPKSDSFLYYLCDSAGQIERKFLYEDANGTNLPPRSCEKWLVGMNYQSEIIGNWWTEMINSGDSRMQFPFRVPNGFTTLTKACIVIIPDTTETIQYDLYASVASIGEAYDGDDRTLENQTLAVTQGQIAEIDVSGVLSSISTGDYVSIVIHTDIDQINTLGLFLKCDESE